MKSQSDVTRRPPIDAQQGFWNQWNQTWRFRDPDEFMERQRETAVAILRKRGLSNVRILDVGCGTGWLGNSLREFGKVWATDLSEQATSEGRRRHPEVQFLCGDFLSMALPGTFDLVVSADSLNNIYDQPACVRRMADCLRAGGMLLLMTPNRTVWHWRGAPKPLGEGQVQAAPSLAEYRALLAPYFQIERVSTIHPGGTRGPLFWVENRYVRGAVGRLIGRQRWRAVLEAARLGREYVIIARRRTA